MSNNWKRGFIVTREAMRPASTAKECFYCHQAVGEIHEADCVMVRRLVRLRATIEYVKEVPADWDASRIEFRYNESTWCADNIVHDIKEWIEAREAAEYGCLCQHVDVEYVDEFAGSGEYLNEETKEIPQNDAAMDLVRRGLEMMYRRGGAEDENIRRAVNDAVVALAQSVVNGLPSPRKEV